MRAWRVTMAVVLLGGIGAPVLLPILALVGQPAAWQALAEPERLLELAGQSLLLMGGTLALALPAGIAGAVLFYRSDLPLASWFRFLTILTLFVPLPLFATAWQAVLGAAGFGQPWALGMLSAIGIHAVAGLPWIVWLVGQGLLWVERELEEDALLDAGPWRVLGRVTLPRARGAIAAAGLWVALQTGGEITVTDMMQVRTFAEEAYTQFVTGGGAEQARALAVSLPAVLVTCVLVLVVVPGWERTLPAGRPTGPPLCLIRLGAARVPACLAVLAVVAFLTVVPLAGLVWQAGRGGSPESWSAGRTAEQLFRALANDAGLLTDSLALAVLAGAVASGLALVACWLAVESPGFRWLVLGVMAATWAMPAPVIGFGLKEQAIEGLMRLEEAVGGPGLARRFLYDGPSILPLVWVVVLRFFPCAVAVLWPVVRLVPRELREAARLDGAGPAAELLYVMAPICAPAAGLAALAVGVLSLGELGAGKLVATPGSQTFAHRIFSEMHTGVRPPLAALCLVVLLAVSIGGGLAALAGRRSSRPADHDRS